MSYLTKKSADAEGKRWKATMPVGWKLDVWANLGWHWCLQNGPITIYSPTFAGSGFHCMIAGSVGKSRHCSGEWESQSGKTPLIALQKAVDAATKVMNETKNRHMSLRCKIEGVLFQCKSKSVPATTKSKSVKRNTNSRSRT